MDTTTNAAPLTIRFDGAHYVATGKTGTNFADGSPAAEYRLRDEKGDHRAWLNLTTGTMVRE